MTYTMLGLTLLGAGLVLVFFPKEAALQTTVFAAACLTTSGILIRTGQFAVWVKT